MCGCYRLTAKERYLRDHFGLDEEDMRWAARWNIAPTQEVPTVHQDVKRSQRNWSLARWGLIPSWVKDASIGYSTINAQSETAAEKPAFREAMKWHRCLIPADGFYEWRKLSSKKKQLYSLGLTDGGLFAFAGLWETWRDRAAGETI